MGIFDGIPELVAKTASEHGLKWNGKYSSDNFLRRFNELSKTNAQKLVQDILLGVLEAISSQAKSACNERLTRQSESRGLLRTATDLSLDRQLRNRDKSEDWEVTIERTAVYLNLCDKKYDWFNQFNVAGGFCGSKADRKVAIDIVRRLKNRPDEAEFIELKEWKSKDHPFYVALEIYRYFCVYFVLAIRNVDSTNNRWPRFRKVDLCYMAPDEWFDRFPEASDVFKVFSNALKNLPIFVEEGVSVSFRSQGLRLCGFKREEFSSHFKNAGEGHVHHLNEMIDPKGYRALHGWVKKAFQS